MKWEDPIVEKVRKIREQLLAEAGGFDAYIRKLQKKELEHPDLLVSKEQLKKEIIKTHQVS